MFALGENLTSRCNYTLPFISSKQKMGFCKFYRRSFEVCFNAEEWIRLVLSLD
uniref:Uncharacterized protein n=1 Tax=Rhizophora mucronata TaxID=61149 RepID=A0A2P2MPB9_RHIMU